MKCFLIYISFLFNIFCFSQTETISLCNTVGEVAYESKDHRSNVYEVVSDRKTINNNQFQSVIIAATDYYPYGSEIGARSFSGDYKYGFQGQEKDEEVKGKGNSVNYKYRMHDARVGRFFAVDPLANKYPYYSSYQFSGNKTIAYVELEGLEEIFYVNGFLPPIPKNLNPSYKTLQNYWKKDSESKNINVVPEFVSKVNNYLNYNESNTHFINGSTRSTDGTPFSSVISRAFYGFMEMKKLIEEGWLKEFDSDKPITFVAHSQGNAHALGMILYLNKYIENYNKKNKTDISIPINVIVLSPFQGDEFSFAFFKNVNAIQFTYENDYYKVRDMKGVTDANSEQKEYKVPYGPAHNATISDEEPLNEIIIEDKKKKKFKKNNQNNSSQ